MSWSLARRASNYLTLIAVLGLWQLVAGYIYPQFNPTSQNIFPAPSTILAIGWDLLRSGELERHALVSVTRVAIGFLIAAGVAVPLGLSMGLWPRWGRQMRVIVEVLRPIPPFAWIPFGLLWFGVGDQEAIFVIFIASVFPILLNTVAGVESVELTLRRSGECLGAEGVRLFRYVIFPSALPQIVVGLRIGLAFAWMVLVAAELIGSTSGLGYLILDSRNLGLPSLACMGMFVIGVVGYALDLLIRRTERTLLPWHS
jgi:NitT/TauT family transport system permease protein